MANLESIFYPPLRGSILRVGTCQIPSLAENTRWSRVWQLDNSAVWCLLSISTPFIHFLDQSELMNQANDYCPIFAQFDSETTVETN